MKVERMRVDKLYQQKQLVEWQQQDYRDMNLKLKALYDNVFNMKLQGTYLKYKATGTMPSGVSSDNYFTAIAGSTAIPGDYSVKVTALATSAKKESSGSISKILQGTSLNYPIDTTTNNQFIISVDGIEKTVVLTQKNYDGTAGNTLTDLKNDIQAKIDALFGANQVTVGLNGSSLTFQPAGDYKPSIVLKDSPTANVLESLGFQNGDYYKINPNAPLRTEYAKFTNNPFGADYIIAFTINGKQFSFDLSDTGAEKNYTLNDILSKISSDPDANVNAYYDSITDKVVIKSKDTGISSSVSIVNTSGNLFGSSGALQVDTTNTVYGTNAKITFNGIDIEKTTNSFTLNGIQFNLRQTMTDTATLRVESDIDGVVANIKGFIDKYNETIDAINAKLSEERYRDYLPLTDEQKKDMKDTDIKLWEEKAKSGLLRSDSLLSGIVDKMRQALYTPVSGLRSDMDSLSEIGITTGGYWEKGKLHLDESKLRDALAKDPNAVAKLFTVFSDDKNTDNDGIAVRLYNVIKSGMDSITDKAGGGDYQLYDNSLLGKQVRDINDRISIMEDQLKSIEDRYYRQFTQMEQAIAAMNQQSMWLSQQLGMGGQG
ncbi:flagellar hook-associated protein [Biomaibacter acetigenes]|uniref:Flagellar hook-associated protein 2 n=2 Tax=Biomaibacter acetigenes TaxID=2316383 RepID=A0A3G2R9V5_9FIRM|nr:flagellar hook-associated protein [Biomaibacter acetigenes]